MNKTWTKEEEDWIRENAGRMTDDDLVRSFFSFFKKVITKSALQSKRYRMGIKKGHGRGRFEVVEF